MLKLLMIKRLNILTPLLGTCAPAFYLGSLT